MIYLVYVWLLILTVILLANARTIAQNTALIAKQEEEIRQLQNESAYLHRQLALRRRARGTAEHPGRSIEQLERRAMEIRDKLSTKEVVEE